MAQVEGREVAGKRTAISKGRRFEIFKRDQFTCQYCGAHPPGTILHVDHIVAVANGGGSSDDNLITSCLTCNLGKSATPLNAIPESLKDKAARVAEQEAQILGYQEIMEARRERIDDEAWRVGEILDPDAMKLGIDRRQLASIRTFNSRLGVHAVLDAAEVARNKFPCGNQQTFRYFCGICWNIIKRDDE